MILPIRAKVRIFLLIDEKLIIKKTFTVNLIEVNSQQKINKKKVFIFLLELTTYVERTTKGPRKSHR